MLMITEKGTTVELLISTIQPEERVSHRTIHQTVYAELKCRSNAIFEIVERAFFNSSGCTDY